MIHLGDITKINGATAPAVDIITGGSPCQDLSVAGKRAGLAGERSGLFMEQIRIIKEMRKHDKETNRRTNEFIRPRWMVWENVPGAFSSNNGEDFRAVLEETARVADENAVIPRLAKGQKWTPAGCIMGDGWSIAWRVHDAQFWGVPQRRKRISLVADFAGGSAPEILFERKSVHGDFEKSGNPREETPRDAGEGAAQTGRCLNRWDVQSKHIQPEHGIAEALYSGECRHGGGESYVMQTGRALSFQERAGKPGGEKGILIQDEHTGALSTLNNQSVVYGISAYDSNSMKSPNPNSGIYKAETARTLDLNGGSPACNQGGMAVVQSAGFDGNMGAKAGNIGYEEEKAPTLNAGKQMQCICMEEKKQTVFDWHRQDTRMTELKDVCVTAAAGWGGGGNNMPYVLEEKKAPMVMSEVAAGLCAQDGRGGVHSQRLADPEGNFMLEPVVASKASHFTHGIEGGVSDTLYASDYKEPQLVAFTTEMTPKTDETGKAFSLRSRDYKDAPSVAYGVDCYNQTQSKEITQTLRAKAADSDHIPCTYGTIVRRLTPMECERLQGYPTIRKVRFTEMTKDEYIAWNINEGNIIVNTNEGKVYGTRGPGGIKLKEPKELPGSDVNGYLAVGIRNGETKMSCKIHRIIWIAEHGIIPEGYVIDHINNDKKDNRIENLQILTPAENSTKAKNDGLYKNHEDAKQSKITDEVHDLIQYIYGNSDISIRELAEKFGISKSRVHQIIHENGWTNIGDWTDSKGKTHKGDSDAPRYKALGNSIALPFWEWMAKRMTAYITDHKPTMASLFDGIGGFSLVFSRSGADPIWASEIEEFPIAVTKIRFPEKEEE